MTLKELRQKLSDAINKARQIKDAADKREADKRSFTPEEKGQVEALLKEADEYQIQVRALEEEGEQRSRIDKYIAEMEESRGRRTDPGQPGEPRNKRKGEEGDPTNDDRRAAFRSWLRRGERGLTQAQRQLLGQARSMDELLGDNFEAIGSDAEELRNLNTTSGGAGGFTVPELFHKEMSEAMALYQGVVSGGAEILPTDSGQDLPIPSNDDTANEAVIVAETVAQTADTMTFAQTVLSTFMYSTKIIPVSLQLMQDSAFPIDSWLQKKLIERMGRGTNTHFTTGTGVGQPRGIITALGTGAGIGVNTAANNAITADEILNLQHSVDPVYRERGKYGFSDGILNRIRLLKDLQGRYLLNDATQGAPATIFGKGYTIYTKMGATITPSTTLALFGDMSHYKVRPVGQMVVFRFEELYMPNLQKAFVGFQRFGGNFINPGNWPVKGLRTIA